MNGYSVLVVGCGELGSRHLQAVATLDEVRKIQVVDPNPKGQELGRSRLQEISPKSRMVDVQWFSSISEVDSGGDLCIVATQADVRYKVLRQIVKELGYKTFLLEKVVAQSLGQYQAILDLEDSYGLSIWVNCKSRAHFSHKRVKSQLNPNDPIIFTQIGGNHGLVSNGIHAADLFCFYDEVEDMEFGYANIDPVLHVSKRGTNIFDLSGTISGSSSKGSEFYLSFASGSNAPGQFSVSSPTYRAMFDDQTRYFFESTAENNWIWESVPFESNLLVSYMTQQFATDILESGSCELPSIRQCYPAHNFILGSLLSHFNQLMGTEGDLCPVT